MDADTKRWLAHFDEKLDTAIAAHSEARERIVRLEERGKQADVEHRGHRKRLERHATTLQAFERGRTKIAGMAAGIGVAVPVVVWLAVRVFDL